MKVICKGYNTCEFREKCEHSKPHNFIQRQYTYLNCNTVNCCQSNIEPFNNCKCDNISLRRYKLEKLSLNESKM